jgi:hypothetical protein
MDKEREKFNAPGAKEAREKKYAEHIRSNPDMFNLKAKELVARPMKKGGTIKKKKGK